MMAVTTADYDDIEQNIRIVEEESAILV